MPLAFVALRRKGCGSSRKKMFIPSVSNYSFLCNYCCLRDKVRQNTGRNWLAWSWPHCLLFQATMKKLTIYTTQDHFPNTALKGLFHEIFELWFFSSNISPLATGLHPKIFSKTVVNSQRYTSFKSPITPLSHDSAVSTAPLRQNSAVSLTPLS